MSNISYKKLVMVAAVLFISLTPATMAAQDFEDDVNDEPTATVNNIVWLIIGGVTATAIGFLRTQKQLSDN